MQNAVSRNAKEKYITKEFSLIKMSACDCTFYLFLALATIQIPKQLLSNDSIIFQDENQPLTKANIAIYTTLEN